MANNIIRNNNSYIIGVGMLLFMAPLLRASFFEKDLLWIILYSIVLFGLFFLRTSGEKFWNQKINLLEGSSLTLLLIYLLTLFTAINIYGSISSILTLITYFIIYLLISRGLNDEWGGMFLLKSIYYGGLLVSLIGLSSAFGTLTIDGAFEEGRITSTLQYANSMAVYLTVILIIGTYLILRQRSLSTRLIIAAGNYLAFMAFLGSKSRGAWLIYPLVMFIFVFGQEGQKLKSAVATINSIMATMIVMGKVLALQPGKINAGEHWAFLLAGMVLAIGFQYLFEVVYNKVKTNQVKIDRRTVLIVFLVLLAVLIGTAVIGFRYIPQDLVARAGSISLKARNVVERGYFYKDAIKVVADYPVIGTGGDGWASIYKKYQSYYYLTRHVHNQFLQVAVETGILGFLAYLGIWIGFAIQAWSSWRNNSSRSWEREIILVAVCSVIALGLHALIDFTLALPAVSFVLWGFFGIVKSLDGGKGLEEIKRKENRNIHNKNNPWVRGGVAVVLSFLIVASLSCRISLSYGVKGAEAFTNDDLDAAQVNYEKAIKFNPLKSAYYGDLAQVYYKLGIREKESERFSQALSLADRAVSLDQGEAKVLKIRSSINMALKKIPQGVKDAEVAVELSPWETTYYEHLGRVYLVAGNELSQAGQVNAANEYFQKAADIPKVIEKQLAKLTPETRLLWIRSDILAPTEDIKKYALEGARMVSN